MFRTDRTCYLIGRSGWGPLGHEIINHGGVPFIVSWRNLPLRPLLRSKQDQRIIYQWSDGPDSGGN